MPNPRNNLHHEQWDVCHRCDRAWWESAFSFQDGFKLCPDCVDNFDVKMREKIIERALIDVGQYVEGADMRIQAPPFFDDEGIY